jgi:hypothetical protein
MGGGQAGAPADDDHVPWSRPPRHGHRDLASHGAGLPSRAGPNPRTGAGLGPDPARKAIPLLLPLLHGTVQKS